MSFIFKRLEITDVILVKPQVFSDPRGFFTETYKMPDFIDAGIANSFVQDNHSRSTKGVLRGLHYQCAPHEEAKIVRCTRGSVWDVVVDIRPGSSTFKKWISVELNEDNDRAIVVPKGCAHGFQSLTENTMVYYQMNTRYHPECARGFNYLDPSFAVKWPIKDMTISEQDRNLAFFNSI